MTKSLHLGENPITLEDLIDVARHRRAVVLTDAARAAMRVSEDWVAGLSAQMDRGEPTQAIYSINTGFGSLSGRQAFKTSAQARDLSRRLVVSNSAGVGRHLDQEVVRAAMLIRAVSLTRGYSAVRGEVVETILTMLERDVIPAVPEYGSLGASGDLIPLAHMALVMSRDEAGESEIDSGEAWYKGELISGVAAMRSAGVERLVLGPKEGLALLNGTSFSTAQTALALADAETLLATAEVAAAMSIEALMGFGDAFIPELHEARGHPGQIECAANIRRLLAGSALIDGGINSDPKRQPPQDAYSLRCVPQVLGPVRDTLKFIRGVIQTEINAATDNPLIFADRLPGRSLKALSGGNFHAEYVAFAADFLSIVVTEIGNIAERRLFRLNDGTLNRGLPDMLVASEHVGMDCGYMLPQYLAAALVSDCKTLAHPDSVDSIPTCSNQEDHVSMANNAGRHARQIVKNIENVVGIEVLMAAQALELRLAERGEGKDALSPASRAVLAMLRASAATDGRPIDHYERDEVLYPRLHAATALVHSGAVVQTAQAAMG
ncbi:histidine ammonia-lyase [Mesorhizobium soli]|uniref:HAL/PAL/TAL family ammonia-lyase n=1 Tax=Pseudaminobacter soli (ex Li et al. 2025) TaxID=1295366 RepID=UPI002475A468|nr:histidine ammonia-lyase [Mesorhizobium soli]MDH6232240.1 histidine ammonia-lyase [Mesorhizobium soli]